MDILFEQEKRYCIFQWEMRHLTSFSDSYLQHESIQINLKLSRVRKNVCSKHFASWY